MNCAWKELLSVLPLKFRTQVDKLGKENAQQLRLRLGLAPELCLANERITLTGEVTWEDLNFIINTASRYSPWAAQTMAQGYLTAPGGHRIGICGDAVMKNGVIAGIRNVSSLCIRIARDFPGISKGLANLEGSILILGAPGWGKTTLLRDLIRQKAGQGKFLSVADEREELFPLGFPTDSGIEVLTGCPKDQALDMLLRTMSPQIIAMDEITAEKDCQALERAAWCGVDLYATAHASSLHDFLHRSIYAPLVKQNLFQTIVILHQDKSWHLERSGGWTTGGSVRY